MMTMNVVFSNSDLLGSRIRNDKRMTKRRVVFNFGVEYGTEERKLKGIPMAGKAIHLMNPRDCRSHVKEHFSFGPVWPEIIQNCISKVSLKGRYA